MLREVVRVRKPNCPPGLGEVGGKDRCSHCNLFHLRPGYCSALDSPVLRVVAETDGETPIETLSLSETANETLSACDECGKRFTPKRATARYCSSACRLKAHRHGKA
jgi:hypothetical protein